MRIDVLTLFPGWFAGPFDTSLLGKARTGGIIELTAYDLRAWTQDRHQTTDDVPYGGGAGMVLKPEPFFDAVEALYGAIDRRPRTVLLTPRGTPLRQSLVRELADEPGLLLLCGRYEGIDERVHTGLAHDEVSIGDYVLAGGEAAACVLVEAVTRLLPGVMGNASSAQDESFAEGLLEYPQYTRPADYRGMAVPEILRSGDHARVAAWRREQALARTRSLRPDLYRRLAGDAGPAGLGDPDPDGTREPQPDGTSRPPPEPGAD